MEKSARYDFIFLMPLLIFFAYFVFKTTNAAYSDYAGYYFGSKELLNGSYLKVYDTYSLNVLIQQQGFSGIFVSYTPFTPFTALVFAPFLGFDIADSKLLFNCCSCVLFSISLYRLIRKLNFASYILAVIPILFFTSLKNNLLFGQSYLLLFSLLAEGFLSFEKKKLLPASLFWGVAILFKVFPAVIVVFLILKKEYKAAMYLAATCLFMLLTSMVFIGIQPWQFYGHLLPRLNNGELNNSFTYMFQSFFMLTKNAFVYDQLNNPQPILNNSYVFIILNILFKGLMISSAIAVTVRKASNSFAAFSFWLFVSMIISPNGSSYSLVLLLFPAMAIYQQVTHIYNQVLLAILLTLLCNLSLHWFTALPLLLKFPRLYLSLAIAGFFLLTQKAWPNVKTGILILMILFTTSINMFLSTKKIASKYLLKKEDHILITDLFVTDNTLGYNYWTEEGKQQQLTNEKVYNFLPLSVRNKQVLRGEQVLLEEMGWKKDPILINDTTVVYLSDLNRGVGFYTIRKLSLK